ncbi:TPA: CapA family protein [Candidatus Poribacteria bacterium]|nr:CapA family protein [Candidatus Poribacteria bacterium]HEX28823.1 CapA family protein [Candidatus Poribacteria bacterium]
MLTAAFLLMLPSLLGVVQADAEIDLAFLGEMTFTKEMEPLLEEKGAEFPFDGVREVLQSSDLTVGFLNSPITSSGEPDPDVRIPFRAPISVARGLARGGVKLVSLATPHITDYGEEGIKETLDALDWYTVKTVGVGKNLEEARKPVTVSVKGIRVAFLAYLRGDQFTSKYADLETPGPCPLAPEILEREIPKAKKAADLVVVMVHWGIGGRSKGVSEKQRFWAKMMLDLGADIVIGQQSHRLYGAELVNGKPVIYSLADFIFGLYDKLHATTVLPVITFSKDKARRIKLIPILVDNPKRRCQPVILSGDKAKEALNKYGSLCKSLGTRVRISGDVGIISIP